MEMQEEQVYLGEYFQCKSKLCVICTSQILKQDMNNGCSSGSIISPELFLKGVSVFCEMLQIEPKFASDEEWKLVGEENFVQGVCCVQCLGLLSNLVSLHELLLTTKASLKQDVSKLENYIVDSRENEVEYSMNVCLEFRQEVVTSYLNRSSEGTCAEKARTVSRIEIYSEDEATSSMISNDVHWQTSIIVEPKARRSKPFTTSGKKGRQLQEEDKGSKISQCIVKLERLDPENSVASDVVKRKRGRPRKQIDNQEISTTIVPTSKLDYVKKGHYEHTSMSDSTVGRRRRKSVKKFSENNPSKEFDTVDFENNDEYQPSDASISDEEFNPSSRHRKTVMRKETRGRPPAGTIKKIDNKKVSNLPQKRRRGRPPKLTEGSVYSIRDNSTKRRNPADDKLLQDGPNFKPFIVLNADSGLFMYLNVRIQKDFSTLYCKHPGCPFFINNVTYFSDQNGFRLMKFHVKEFHRNHCKLAGTPTVYFCSYCDSQFLGRNQLVEHMRSDHPNADPLPVICEVCGDTMQQQLLMKHLLSHKNREEQSMARVAKRKGSGRQKDITRPMEFPCNECDKVFKCHTELRVHKETHVPIELRRQFQCDLCPIKLSKLSFLASHRQRVHFKDTLSKPFVCKICGREYLKAEKTKYTIHLREHTGETPFQCARCGKAFRSKYNLTLHERRHENKRIQCEFCPNWYKNSVYLRRHQWKHHSELVPRPSREETFKYTNPEYLPDFIGPKVAYPCEPCGRVYKYKSQLISHMKHKHKLFLPRSEDYPNQNTIDEDNPITTIEDPCQPWKEDGISLTA